MHWLDSTILAILAAAAVVGAYSGLLMQLFRLVGFAAALYAAAHLHSGATAWLHDHLLRGAEPRACDAVAYGGVFLVIYLAIFVGTLILERGVLAAQLQNVNRCLGAGLAVVKMSLLIGSVCFALQQLQHEPTKEVLDDSAVAPLLAKSVEQVVAALPADLKTECASGWLQFRDALPTNNAKSKGDALPPSLSPKLRW